jgi:hypothetical protein
MKAISDSYDALFFFKKKSNEMNVGTFKNLVLEYDQTYFCLCFLCMADILLQHQINPYIQLILV